MGKVDADWSEILDEKLKTMEEAIERRLREHFACEQKDHQIGTMDAHDIQDALYNQSEIQHHMNHKIEALEKSCMEFKRKQAKHHTAFLDLRGLSLMLKDILSGILRLVEALGVAIEPEVKQNNM